MSHPINPFHYIEDDPDETSTPRLIRRFGLLDVPVTLRELPDLEDLCDDLTSAELNQWASDLDGEL